MADDVSRIGNYVERLHVRLINSKRVCCSAHEVMQQFALGAASGCCVLNPLRRLDSQERAERRDTNDEPDGHRVAQHRKQRRFEPLRAE